MAEIGADGIVTDSRISNKRTIGIEHGDLDAVKAIVVHQTGTDSTNEVFNSYATGGNGAHFLIDRNGTIYQTASVKKRCYHVGKLIKSKCLQVQGNACKDKDIAKAATLGWTAQINKIDEIERKKSYPERYPVNADSIGIEIVGKSVSDKEYEAVSSAQNDSLQWLVGELHSLLTLQDSDLYRHPEVSYKNPGEAASAVWKKP